MYGLKPVLFRERRRTAGLKEGVCEPEEDLLFLFRFSHPLKPLRHP
jgi:hypothetical protein